MIWHPLLFAVVVGDLLSFMLLIAAAKTAFQTIIKWAPQSATREQIQLERKAETARLSAKFAFIVFFLSTALFIIGITNVLPAIVPGAMCGTGVLQATDGLGGYALIYRFSASFIMMLWLTFEKLNLSRPETPLTRYNSRLLLLAVPFFLLAVITTFRGIMRIDSHRPVDCCAVVYDQFGSLAAARQTAGIPDTFWIWTFWVLTASMLACAVWSLKSQPDGGRKAAGFLAFFTVFWVPAATIALVRVYSAYFYEVLHHHCPWCLLLPEHKFAGVPLFGALAIITIEGPLPFIIAKLSEKYPDILRNARTRIRLAGMKVLLAIIAYAGMVALPAIFWRLHNGVWLH